jgi:UDP:flavonoid glycosyltransferase YjiC (YdhE family)
VQTGWWRLPRKKAPQRRLGDFVLSGPPPLYIGFGSWDIHDKAPVTDAVLEALRITRNRAVLLSATVDRRPDYPPNVLVVDSVSHEWLFPRLKAAVHHGGAGTTGAVSMAGIPSVIVPAFDAQKPWGRLVSQKGIGAMLDRRELNAETLAAAIREVGQDDVRAQARRTGVLLRDERGVEQAADEIERRLWEGTAETAPQRELKLTEVHPVFTSGKYIEDLPSPDPLERGRVTGGDAEAEEPAEDV